MKYLNLNILEKNSSTAQKGSIDSFSESSHIENILFEKDQPCQSKGKLKEDKDSKEILLNQNEIHKDNEVQNQIEEIDNIFEEHNLNEEQKTEESILLDKEEEGDKDENDDQQEKKGEWIAFKKATLDIFEAFREKHKIAMNSAEKIKITK